MLNGLLVRPVASALSSPLPAAVPCARSPHPALVVAPRDESSAATARPLKALISVLKIILLVPFATMMIEALSTRRPAVSSSILSSKPPPKLAPPARPLSSPAFFHGAFWEQPKRQRATSKVAASKVVMPRRYNSTSILTKSSAQRAYVNHRGVVLGPTTRLEAGSRTRRRWAPDREEVAKRHRMIRRLVWLDTEGLLQRFARTDPWNVGESLQDHIRSLQRRSPILQWHVQTNVVSKLPATPSFSLPVLPAMPSSAARLPPRPSAPSGGSGGGAKNPFVAFFAAIAAAFGANKPAAAASGGGSRRSSSRSSSTILTRASSSARSSSSSSSSKSGRGRGRGGALVAPPAASAAGGGLDADKKCVQLKEALEHAPHACIHMCIPHVYGMCIACMHRCIELKEALLEIAPVFFSLVVEATRTEPAAALRIYRRLLRAVAILLSWNVARLMRLGPGRQYTMMNGFLRQLVVVVAECQNVLECDGNEACLVEAYHEADRMVAETERSPQAALELAREQQQQRLRPSKRADGRS